MFVLDMDIFEKNGIDVSRDVDRNIYTLTYPNGKEIKVDGFVFHYEKDLQHLLDLWSC